MQHKPFSKTQPQSPTEEDDAVTVIVEVFCSMTITPHVLSHVTSFRFHRNLPRLTLLDLYSHVNVTPLSVNTRISVSGLSDKSEVGDSVNSRYTHTTHTQILTHAQIPHTYRHTCTHRTHRHTHRDTPHAHTQPNTDTQYTHHTDIHTHTHIHTHNQTQTQPKTVHLPLVSTFTVCLYKMPSTVTSQSKLIS